MPPAGALRFAYGSAPRPPSPPKSTVRPIKSRLLQNSGLSLTLGSDLAAPGLYRFRLWLSCARSPGAAPPITADVSVKSPADASPRGLAGDDVLHRRG